MTPGEVGSGVVVGGWEYITPAYVVFWVVVLGYAASLWLRRSRGGRA